MPQRIGRRNAASADPDTAAGKFLEMGPGVGYRIRHHLTHRLKPPPRSMCVRILPRRLRNVAGWENVLSMAKERPFRETQGLLTA
jgi:hypothetical protein